MIELDQLQHSTLERGELLSRLRQIRILARFGYWKLAKKVIQAVYLRVRRKFGPNTSTIRQVKVNGSQLLVRVEETVGSEIYYLGGIWQAEETHLIEQSVRECDICFDIGANVGYYTLLLGSVARRGMTYSFEPVPLNFHLLRSSILINGISNIIVEGCAVAEQKGERLFAVAKDTGFSSFVNTDRGPIATEARVVVTTIDDYCREQKIPKIDFLKVDVEGAESLVIAGAREILRDKRRRPRLVMLELYEPMLNKYGADIKMVLNEMDDCGYEPFVCNQGALIPYQVEHYSVLYNVFFTPAHREHGE
jgi:FkbM family methyltransferase